LRLDPTDIFEGIEAYQCSGTPVDCVKIAKHHILKGKQPDLVVSGINHGSNSSISVLYSGTMSAAIEAAIEGIPAIGFSFCDYSPVADMAHLKKYVKEIVENVLQKGLPEGVALNVNFPVASATPIKGIKICRQALSKWQEIFEERKDPHGRSYFWMSGSFENEDKGEDTDEFALSNHYISIVPCSYDMTAHHSVSKLNANFAS
jgi:5'-nucleotidase